MAGYAKQTGGGSAPAPEPSPYGSEDDPKSSDGTSSSSDSSEDVIETKWSRILDFKHMYITECMFPERKNKGI